MITINTLHFKPTKKQISKEKAVDKTCAIPALDEIRFISWISLLPLTVEMPSPWPLIGCSHS